MKRFPASEFRLTALALLIAFPALIFFIASAAAAASAGRQASSGVASWYGEELRGEFMANGERFDPDKLTAASWFHPLGTRVRVTTSATAQSESRSVIVTITDRGPSKRLVERGRIIDLSRAAFEKLDDLKVGLVRVSVTVAEP